MMRDAEAYAEEDRAKREEAEVRNTGEALVYQTEKFLRDNSDKIPTDAKANVEGPLDDLKKALQGNDIAAVKTATEKLATASQSLGEAMYAQAGSAAGAAGPSAGTTGSTDSAANAEDEVVEAEIVDEDGHK